MVAVGDVAVIAAEPVELPNGRMVSRAMDNRLGCFVAYETLRLLPEGDAARRATSTPWPSSRRRRTSGRAHDDVRAAPDVALVIDVTHATDAPGIDEKENGEHPFGSGPAIFRGATL